MIDIKAIRAQNNMSQVELAKRAGLGLAIVTLLESGKTKPTIRTAKLLAPHLGVTWVEFFSESEV